MAVFKFVIADKGKCYQIEKDQKDCESLLGLKIGDRFTADILGLDGYELRITGGTDKDGFPMRSDLEGISKRRILLKKSIGFKGTKRRGKKQVKLSGLRRRKTLRGNTIDRHIVQINCNITKYGDKKLDEILVKKTEEAKK